MIPEDELMRLRDIAFEYLPTAQKIQQTKKTKDHEDYYLTLFVTVNSLINRNLSAIELAAARLLQAICLHATADASDIEIYQSTKASIEQAIDKLYVLTDTANPALDKKPLTVFEPELPFNWTNYQRLNLWTGFESVCLLLRENPEIAELLKSQGLDYLPPNNVRQVLMRLERNTIAEIIVPVKHVNGVYYYDKIAILDWADLIGLAVPSDVRAYIEIERKKKYIGQIIQPLISLTKDDKQSYIDNSYEWGIDDAIYILNGYKPPEQQDGEQTAGHFPHLIDYFSRAFRAGEIGRKINEAGKPKIVDKPENWLAFWKIAKINPMNQAETLGRDSAGSQDRKEPTATRTIPARLLPDANYQFLIYRPFEPVFNPDKPLPADREPIPSDFVQPEPDEWFLYDSWGIKLACKLITLGYPVCLESALELVKDRPHDYEEKDRFSSMVRVYERALGIAASSVKVGTIKEHDTPSNWIAWAKSKGYSVVHLMPGDTQPQAEAVRDDDSSNQSSDETFDDCSIDEKLAALFDALTVENLANMFPTDSNKTTKKWKGWQNNAKENGLFKARESHGKYNPYKAGLWFLKRKINGWDIARLNRTLANNLPARSRDDKHLLTGEFD